MIIVSFLFLRLRIKSPWLHSFRRNLPKFCFESQIFFCPPNIFSPSACLWWLWWWSSCLWRRQWPAGPRLLNWISWQKPTSLHYRTPWWISMVLTLNIFVFPKYFLTPVSHSVSHHPPALLHPNWAQVVTGSIHQPVTRASAGRASATHLMMRTNLSEEHGTKWKCIFLT